VLLYLQLGCAGYQMFKNEGFGLFFLNPAFTLLGTGKPPELLEPFQPFAPLSPASASLWFYSPIPIAIGRRMVNPLILFLSSTGNTSVSIHSHPHRGK
jgi:hypothetical protein